MPKFSSKTLLIALGVLVVALIAAGIVFLVVKKPKQQAAAHINLTYWGVYDSKEVMQPIIDKYQKLHSNVTITYEQKKFDSYYDNVTDAFASGSGPDIFEVQNSMMAKFQPLMQPLPDNESTIIDKYYDVVAKDAVMDNKVYGLPYSVDSLALFYNKRLLNKAGITNPPRTWDEFDVAVEKLTKLDAAGHFIQSGAALGGSSATINRATDLVSLFMLQQGTPITDQSKNSVVWDETTTSPSGQTVDRPGQRGLDMYLRYSSATQPVYTWNESQDYSFDLFAEEKTAMILSYAYQLPIIRGNNPKMQLGIAPVPQPKDANQKITLASYWLETVAAESKNAATAWDFVKFATNTENDKLYSTETNKPASRRDLITEGLNDPDLSTFTDQNLYAESWYQYDGKKVEDILDTMVKNLLKGVVTGEDAFDKATSDIQAVISEGAQTKQALQAAAQAVQQAAKALQAKQKAGSKK